MYGFCLPRAPRGRAGSSKKRLAAFSFERARARAFSCVLGAIGGPENTQERPRAPQETAKEPQESPQEPPKARSRPPAAPQERPRWPKRALREGQRGPQNASGGTKSTPRRSPRGKKSISSKVLRARARSSASASDPPRSTPNRPRIVSKRRLMHWKLLSASKLLLILENVLAFECSCIKNNARASKTGLSTSAEHTHLGSSQASNAINASKDVISSS